MMRRAVELGTQTEAAGAVGASPAAGAGEAFEPPERARVVRLCAHLTGDSEAAEDLAQETLFEAWRAGHKLSSSATAAERRRWLAGVARNVCMRWARQRGREAARHATPTVAGATESGAAVDVGLDDLPGDVFDLEVELERQELVHLLDRAMALLPAETRRVLIERYVQESPQAETALRLGLSEGAVAMKLQRGRLALRRLLTTEFHQEAVGLGLVDGAAQVWRETRLWCQACGQRRFVGRMSPDRRQFWLRCPGCGSYNHSATSARAGLSWQDVKGFRPMLTRLMVWMDPFYRRALSPELVPCMGCGRPLRFTLSGGPGQRNVLEILARCGPCGSQIQTSQSWLALCTPEGRQFYREHERIRNVEQRLVDVGPAGGPALVTSYHAVATAARLDVVSAADTLRVLGVHRTGGKARRGVSAGEA